MLILSAVNAYLGAWVTAGIAAGGLIFSMFQSIASAISNYLATKNKSDNALKLEEQKTKQRELTLRQEEKDDIRIAFKNYYVQTALSIYKKEKLEAQIIAYGELQPYVSKIGFNSNLYDIQEKIANGDFVTADKKFHIYLPNLKLEETQLLSQLEGLPPTDHKDDSLDLQVEPQKQR